MIKLENVTFGYEEGQEVLKDYNLSIKKGEFITILGHNGSGKSTLSKLLVGLVEANSGKIYVDNQQNADVFKSTDKVLNVINSVIKEK